jgi:type IV pilus assembly protein PilM
VADEQSIWKKEISFGRKKQQPDAAPEEPKAEETSVWKKEISFSRKSKTPKAEPAAAEPKVPWYKKEISLGGGKSKAKEAERLAAEAAAAVAAPEPAPAPPAPVVPEAAPAPVAPEPVAVEPVVAEAVAPQQPVVAHEPVAPQQPVAPEPVAAEAAPQVAPVPVQPEPEVEVFYTAPAAPASAPAPVPVAEEPTAVMPAPVESWEAPAEVPPAPEPALVEPQVVQPPVPAAELPPLPDEAPAKTPWWKKEIGGKKKTEPTLLPEDDDAPAKTPWYKKEIGGKRAPKPAKPAADVAAPTPAKTPWYKKEIGGGRKKGAPAAIANVPAPVEASAPAAKKTPFWKKDLSLAKKPKEARAKKPARASGGSFLKLELGSLKLPSLSGGGKTKKGAKHKKLVGLKLGGSQIAAARVANNGHAELLQVARQPLEQGVIVGGELRDPEALSEQLKSFFALNKLPRRNVRLGIASNRIGVRIFDVGGITDDKALTNAIQFRAQEALPIPLDEAVLDYQVLGESVDAEGQPMKRILLVVAYRELVDRYVSACRKAGISLVGIDLEAFALLRALAAPRPETTEATAALVAVAIGHDRSTFAVSDGRVCEFTRVLEWGGAAVSVALARALNLAPSEVESIKRAISLDGSGEIPEGLTPEQNAAAVDAVRKQIQSFARELVSSLQFYQNQPGSLGIGEIVLSGGSAHLPGFAEELQRLIGVAVRIGDPLARVKVAKKVGTPQQIGSLAVAIGLGIED